MESVLESTGVPILDTLSGVTTPRIDAFAAFESVGFAGLHAYSDGDDVTGVLCPLPGCSFDIGAAAFSDASIRLLSQASTAAAVPGETGALKNVDAVPLTVLVSFDPSMEGAVTGMAGRIEASCLTGSGAHDGADGIANGPFWVAEPFDDTTPVFPAPTTSPLRWCWTTAPAAPSR